MSPRKHTILCRSNVAPLREALVKHPRQAWRNVGTEWKALGFAAKPDAGEAEREFDALMGLLASRGVNLHFLPEASGTDADSIYIHDPVTAVGDGLLLCHMGKSNRGNEPGAASDWAKKAGWPVLGTISSPGLLEGGDLIWIDQDTVVVGLGFRSNAQGARQLEAFVDAEVLTVPLPWHRGPGDVLHLMSLISPLDRKLALIHRPLLPVPFGHLLEQRGYELLVLPENEYDTLGCNVLALAPRVCLLAEGNPRTERLLRDAGCEVLTYSGREISLKGMGGPTCLTRPLVRK